MSINDYTFEQEIGRGGMGCVYRGRTPDGRPAAIKMLENRFASDPDYRFFFEGEAKALMRMDHPSVVKILAVPFQDAHGNLYLPMELVEGKTIEQHVRADGPYPEQDAIRLMGKILEAFEYIHGIGMVHRDIKPSNIMIRPDGSICVIDFGIAKDMKVSTGKTIGTMVGTDGYMSPEQITALNIDHRTDIYSLGCLLHFMLTGQHAIVKQSNEYATKMVILNNDFPSARQLRPELSEQIQSVIYKAVDKNMTKRYQTARQFAMALSAGPTPVGTMVTGAKVTIGRASDNDIVIDDKYVSSHHLTIYYKPMHGSATGAVLEVRDHSTNGTGVDGKRLHKGSMMFDYDIHAAVTQVLPVVLLAGRPEISLDWQPVIERLRANLPPPTDTTHGPDNVHIDQVATQTPAPQDKLNVGLGILSFFVPVVGWVLWGVWKNERPHAARTASRIAWIGFAANLIYYFITENITS